MERSLSRPVDPAVVRKARSGDAAARAVLYDSLAADVYTLARRVVGSDSAAEDVLHEAFIDAFTKLDDLRDGDVILEIGGRTPQSVGHAMRIIRSFEPDETLEITIMREHRRQSVELSR